MNKIVLTSIFAIIVTSLILALHYLMKEAPKQSTPSTEPVIFDSPQNIFGDKSYVSESADMNDNLTDKVNQTDAMSNSQIFLSEVGVSGRSLITLFETTQELRWLRRAQEEFPNDLHVVIASAFYEVPDRRKWIEKWEKLEPGNGLPLFLKANVLMEDGRQDESGEAFNESIQREWVSYSNDRVNGRVDFLLATDNYDYKTYWELLDSPIDAGFSDVTGKQVERLLQELMGDEDPVTRTEVTDGLALAQRFRNLDLPGVASTYAAAMIETSILSLIDSEVGYGDTGVTVGERKESLTGEIREYRGLLEFVGNISDALSPYEHRQLLERVRSQGELEAYRWLKDKRGDFESN